MTTQTAYFTGPCKWAKVYKPDDTFGDPIWSIVVYLDDSNLENFQKTGMAMSPKTDDEGTFVTFRRRQFQNFKNERKEFPPPEVINAEGAPFSEMIGNGSTVTVKVEFFPTKRGVGSRLLKVRVDEHIPYVSESAATQTVAPANNLPF
jgi:hypothetical protein